MKKLLILIVMTRLIWAQTLDTNGDGKVEQSEWQAASAQIKAKYDTNGDGQIDEAEKQAASQAIRAKLDTNGDGKVDESERQNALAKWRNRRSAPK